MLEHLVQKFLTTEEKNRMLNDERELYGHDLIHVLQVYAKKCGISLNELNCHCLADAERLFTAQRLPHVSQIMQELKLLLERGY